MLFELIKYMQKDVRGQFGGQLIINSSLTNFSELYQYSLLKTVIWGKRGKLEIIKI